MEEGRDEYGGARWKLQNTPDIPEDQMSAPLWIEGTEGCDGDPAPSNGGWKVLRRGYSLRSYGEADVCPGAR